MQRQHKTPGMMIVEKEVLSSYSDLLKHEKWLEKRRFILQRDQYRCRNCGSAAELEVHHRQYHFIKTNRVFRKPWEYENTNLLALCNRCHQVGHAKYKVPVFYV